MALAKLSIDLDAKLAGLQTSLDKANRSIDKSAGQMRKAFDTTRVAIGGLAAALAAAFSVRAGASFVQEAIDSADAAAKQARQVGLLTEEITALNYAAGLSGVSQQELTTGLVRLARVAQDADDGVKSAADAFKVLGISVRNADGTLKGSNQLLEEIADAYQAMPDGIRKTANATDLFSRSGAKLISLLNGGKEGLEAFRKEAEAAGVVIGTETAVQAEAFNDNISRLQTSVNSLALDMAKYLLPTLVRLSERMVQNSRDAGIMRGAFITLYESMLGSLDPLERTTEKAADLRREIEGLQSLLSVLPDQKSLEAVALSNQIDAKLAELEQLRNSIKALQPDPTPPAATTGDGGGGAGSKPPPSRGGRDAAAEAAARFREEQRKLSLLNPLAVGGDQFDAEAQRLQRLSDVLAGLPQVMTPVMTANDEIKQGFLQSEKAAYDLGDAIEDVGEKAKDSQDFARDLGLTFSSAFEDAIVEGGKLSDVIRGLEQDILRLVTRELVTKPLGTAITGFIGGKDGKDGIEGLFASLLGGGKGGSGFLSGVGSFFSSIFGGFFADGGYLRPGQIGIAGERGPELIYGGRSGMTVQPSGAGAVSVVINQSFAAGTDMRTQSQIAAATGSAVQRALARNR